MRAAQGLKSLIDVVAGEKVAKPPCPSEAKLRNGARRHMKSGGRYREL